jgi:hypothetical protein
VEISPSIPFSFYYVPICCTYLLAPSIKALYIYIYEVTILLYTFGKMVLFKCFMAAGSCHHCHCSSWRSCTNQPSSPLPKLHCHDISILASMQDVPCFSLNLVLVRHFYELWLNGSIESRVSRSCTFRLQRHMSLVVYCGASAHTFLAPEVPHQLVLHEQHC